LYLEIGAMNPSKSFSNFKNDSLNTRHNRDQSTNFLNHINKVTDTNTFFTVLLVCAHLHQGPAKLWSSNQSLTCQNKLSKNRQH
jgi:serine phosphatase RsbU (regulator of sigma subunit)